MTIRAIFLGTPDFSVPSLKALLNHPEVEVCAVFTQPDKPAGRGGAMRESPIKVVALSEKIPVFQPRSLRKELPAVLEQLQALGPIDIGIVVAFGQILPKAVLELPRMGCVNVHASLLPRWRGAAPIQRALLAGDKESGVCLMHMDEGLDTGAVYSREAISLCPTETGGTLHDRLSILGAELLKRDLDGIVSGELRAMPQCDEGLTYAAKITSADTAIDWNSSAETIEHQVRAFEPFPGAFTTWRGKRLKIYRAQAVTETSSPGSPGTVLSSHGEQLVVACGVGSLGITELQLEGKKRMTTADLLRGASLTPGDHFGVRPAQAV